MERVLGIGGYFMRAADPAALSAWYRDCLGLDADENGLWRQEGGPTVFATFESETDYFGSRAQLAMINFRVRDLDAMLAQLRAKGADVAEETQDVDAEAQPAATTLVVYAAADLDMAFRVLENARCQRPATCNAAEKVIVHAGVAPTFIPNVLVDTASVAGTTTSAARAAQIRATRERRV